MGAVAGRLLAFEIQADGRKILGKAVLAILSCCKSEGHLLDVQDHRWAKILSPCVFYRLKSFGLTHIGVLPAKVRRVMPARDPAG